MAGGVRLGLALSNETPLATTIALARRAEELDLSEVWLPESRHGRTATTVATAVGLATRRVKIGLGVLNPFWRHPSLIAMDAATIDEAIGGRLMLGLGAAIWTLTALGEADERTAKPLSSIVEATRLIGAMLRSEDGPEPRIFAARADSRLDFTPLRPDLPIYFGAVNARMMEAAGEWADGAYLGAITSPGYVRWSRARLAAGAARAGRDVNAIDLIANVLVSVDRDRRAAREAVRKVLAYYLGRVEAVVRDEAGADPEALAGVRAKVERDGPEAAARSLPDALIDVFAAAGDPDDVGESLRRYADAGLRGVLAWHVIGPVPTEGLRLLAETVWPTVSSATESGQHLGR